MDAEYMIMCMHINEDLMLMYAGTSRAEIEEAGREREEEEYREVIEENEC